MKRILFYFQQVGGANALWPLIDEWGGLFEMVVGGRPKISDHLKRKGVVPADAAPYGCSSAAADAWLRDIGPDILVTDTIDLGRAPDTCFGRSLWRAARRRAIPSIAYVDCWWGYRQRFFPGGKTQPSILPDTVAVIDRTAADQALEAGLGEARVRVLGSPLFAELKTRRAGLKNGVRTAAREKLGLPRDTFLVLYVSQPFSTGFGTEADWGFSPVSVLKDLLRVLEGAGGKTRRLTLLVLMHPEDAGDDLFLAGTGATGVSVVFRRGGAPHDYLLASDLVCGSFSILLTEAVILGLPVLSLQPGLRREDILITNLSGATRPVRTDGELKTHFLRAVVDGGYRRELLRRQDGFEFVTDSLHLWRRQVLGMLSQEHVHAHG
ncbi:MAG TPA: hypothetical protein VLT88_00890 [Desulfosarcina sp.]|nr:hypothetical protein [Desulfosarcina sp.]